LPEGLPTVAPGGFAQVGWLSAPGAGNPEPRHRPPPWQWRRPFGLRAGRPPNNLHNVTFRRHRPGRDGLFELLAPQIVCVC
jgi:hypothetical protein